MTYLVEASVDHEFFKTGGENISSSRLSTEDQRLWSSFSESTDVIRHDVAGRAFWNYVVVEDQSNASQFDRIASLANNKDETLLPESFATVALTGSGFHGNRGRPWSAMPGNLHLSSFCKCDLDAAECGPALSMLPTVAVTDVLDEINGSSLVGRHWIKWVNDVYIDDAKVSGSLVSTNVVVDRVVSFALGIGLNLKSAPDLSSDIFGSQATSLEEKGIGVSLPGMLDRLLQALALRIRQLSSPDGPAELFVAYRERVGGVGRTVEIYPESNVIGNKSRCIAAGRLRAVHPDLSLEIEGGGTHWAGRLRFADR